MGRNDASLTEGQLTLRDLMTDLGERFFYVGWRTGLEFEMWAAIMDPAGHRYRTRGLDASGLNEVRDMACALGGWITWVSTGDEMWDGRCCFLPMSEWLSLLEQRAYARRLGLDRRAAA